MGRAGRLGASLARLRRNAGRRVGQQAGRALRDGPAYVRSLLGTAAGCLGGVSVVAVFVTCSLVMFKDALLNNRLFWQPDTLMFYYPIGERIDRALESGHLPLWTRSIFGGHPLLADGEAGMFYPLNLLAWWLFSAADALVLLRLVRFSLAGLLTYGFVRTLGLSRTASVVGGLVFAFGSFMVGQLHHANMSMSIIWLPLALRYAELAIQTTGSRRSVNIVLVGVALGFQVLTIHINAVLMTGMVLGSYVAFRCLVGPVAGQAGRIVARGRHLLVRVWRGIAGAVALLLRRAILALAVLGGAALVAFGLGAVQLLPLWELAQQSPRYGGVSYRFATEFALPPANLLTLLFPYFFRDASDRYWSPWFRWDTTVYVGIAPLILALFAIFLVRNRHTVYCAALALVGVLLALGDYLPLKIYALLWQLPAFSMTRVPSRFTLFTVLGLAVLAAQGLDHLQKTLSVRAECAVNMAVWRGRVVAWVQAAVGHADALGLRMRAWSDEAERWIATLREKLPALMEVVPGLLVCAGELPAAMSWLLPRLWRWVGGPRRRGVLIILGLMVMVTGGLVLALQEAQTWVSAHPEDTTALMMQLYPRDKLNPPLDMPSRDALAGLRLSLASTSRWTRWSVIWLMLTVGLLALWYRVRLLGHVWQSVIVLLVAADLVLFARDFHPRLNRDDLAPRTGVVRFLQEHKGLHRVYVAWPVTVVGPNRLLPYRIEEAGGYSSLATQRYTQYMAHVQKWPQRFLDLMNVRYVVASPLSGQDQLAAAKKVFDEGGTAVYERATCLPRAYMVGEARFVRNERDALQFLDLPTLDPSTTVVLEGAAGGEGTTATAETAEVDPIVTSRWAQLGEPPLMPPPSDPAAKEVVTRTAEVVVYETDYVQVQTGASQPAYLVLSDTYYPGWEAAVDGKPAPIHRANSLFRAVRVPEGRHTVEFRFRPASVAYGGLMSLVTGALVMAALAAGVIRLLTRRKERGRES